MRMKRIVSAMGAAGVAAGVIITASSASAVEDVSVITPVLEVSGTGQAVGIPLIANVATSVIVGSLPPELAASDAGIALSALPSQVAGEVVVANAGGIAAMKEAVSRLAAANGPINFVIDGTTTALDEAAGSAHPLIQPLDTTLHQVATVLRGLER
jgi:hypothetical protein